jgi:hypothetical protein
VDAQWQNNPALLTMWGTTPEHAIGKRLIDVGYEPWHAAVAAIRGALQG